MAIDNKIQDPSVIGTSGLSGLKYESNHEGTSRLYDWDELPFEIQQARGSLPIYTPQNRVQEIMYGVNPQENIGFPGINDSRFDRRVSDKQDLYDLEEFRAKEQNAFNAVAGAYARAGVIAGTEFIRSSIIGLGVNLLMLAAGEGFVDNPFNRALNNIKDWSREVFPEHLTRYEQESPWNRWGSGNFLGSLIETAGYQTGNVGAMLFGGVGSLSAKMGGAIAKGMSAGLNMVKAGSKVSAPLLNQFSKAATISRNKGVVSSILSSAAGATSEATVESLAAKDEFIQKGEQDIFAYAETDPSYDVDSALKKLYEDADKIGEATYLANVSLLTLSNFGQWGRVMSGKFGTARKAYTSISKLKTGLNASGKAISEGGEEMAQRILSSGAKDKYGSDFNTFYGERILPEYDNEVKTLLNSIIDSSGSELKNDEAWFEFMAGGLMGGMGTVAFRKPVDKKTGKFNFPIYFEGGISGEIREGRERNARAEILSQEIDNWFALPQNRETYQGIVRHQALQAAMDEAIQKNDHYRYSNSEHEQLLSDIIMFDKAGRMEDLYSIIDRTSNLSDEDITEIRESMYNIETKKSSFDGLTDSDVRDIVQDRAKEIKSTIENYQKIQRDLTTVMGDVFQESGLEEMTYMMSQIDNWQTRFTDIHNKVKELLSPYVETLVGDNIKGQERTDEINNITQLLSSDPITLLSEIVVYDISDALNLEQKIDKARKQKKKRSNLITGLDNLKNRIEKTLEVRSKFLDMSKDIEDMQKIAVARADFIKKYNGYLNNPQKLIEDIAKKNESIYAEANNIEENSLALSLSQAQNTMEFDSILSNEQDVELKDKIVNQLIQDGNKVAISYQDEFNYSKNVKDELGKISNPYIKSNSRKIYDQYKKLNPGIENIANPVGLSSQTRESLELTRMSLPEFKVALNEVINALYTINESDSYINRFNPNYRKPSVKTLPEKQGEVVSSNDLTPETKQAIIGEATKQEIEEDSIKIEEDRKKQQSNKVSRNVVNGRNYFYRPAISDSRPKFDSDVNERRFDFLVKFLENEGAFDYIDDGHLQVGDEIRFIIKEESRYIDKETNQVFPPIILMVKGEQVVGSLNESGVAIDKTEGLKKIIDTVTNAYYGAGGGQAGTAASWDASPVVHVTELLDGKIFYDNKLRSIKDIPNTDKIKLGVVKNGVLTTNDSNVTPDKIDLANPLINQEGRVYMLTPTLSGKYRPIAIRTKRFTKDIVGSLMWDNQIKSKLQRIASAINSPTLFEAKKLLEDDIYLEGIQFDFVQPSGLSAIRIQRRGDRNKDNAKLIFLETEGESIEDANGISWGNANNRREVEDIVNEIADALYSFNLPIQVAVGQINQKGYNSYLINSDVLESDAIDAKLKYGWFLTEYIDSNGNAKSLSKEVNSIIPETHDVKEGVNIDVRPGIVVNENGSDITDETNIAEPTEKTTISESDISMDEAMSMVNTLKPKRRSRPNNNVKKQQEEINPSLPTPTVDENIVSDIDKLRTFGIPIFDKLPKEVKGLLELKGWNKEQFDKLSYQEKDHEIKCLGI